MYAKFFLTGMTFKMHMVLEQWGLLLQLTPTVAAIICEPLDQFIQ